MNKAEQITALLGGVRPAARALGVDVNIVLRAHKRGYYQPHYNTRLVEAADKAGADLAALEPYLIRNVCPCCGQQLPEGVVPNVR